MNLPGQSLNTSQILDILNLSKFPTAIYTSEAFIIEEANEAMLALWKKDKSVIGLPLKDVVPEFVHQPFTDQLEKVWQSGQALCLNEVPVYTAGKSVSIRYYVVDFQPVKDNSGEVFGILHTATEVLRKGTNGRDHHSADNASLVDPSLNAFFSAKNSTEESQHDRVRRFFMQAPAGICILDGPDFVFELVNPLYQQFFPGRDLMGKPILEALPELTGKPVWDILQRVYKTGETFEGKELHVPLAYTVEGKVADRYFDFIYQARFDAQDNIDGILVFVIEVTDNVLNRQTVEEKESSLRSLVMASHYGLMILKGKEMRIEIVNQQIANLWQKTLQDITGKTLLEVLPELKDQPFPALLTNVYQTGNGYGQEEEVLYIETEEGTVKKYVSFYYDPTRDVNGNVTGVVVACEDVTERVKSRVMLQDSYEEQQTLNEELSSTNEELAAVNEEMSATYEELLGTQADLEKMVNFFERSENKLRAMVESAPFPIGVYEGREMRIALANRSMMDVWGKGYDLAGRLYSEILPELENQEIFGQLDAVYSTGIPFHARNQQVDLVVDGKLKTFYFNYSFTPLYDLQGNIYGVMNTAADVTDLNLAKQQIQQNERNLHNMILQAPVAMCILLGPEHIITVANSRIIEIWGKPAEEVINKPVFEALPDARAQGLEQLMSDVYYKGKTFHAAEMPVNLIRNGVPDTVYQNFVYQPYKDSDGSILGIIAITIDVTEQVLARKRIEENEAQLLETKKRLEQELEAGKKIQRQKDGFIGIASHELKTPLTSLTAIIQVASLKLKNSNDEFLVGAMEKAQAQVKRMRSMINGFLNISRLESGNIVIERHQFDMKELILEVIEELKLTAGSHQIHLTPCTSITINGDQDKINSVVSNLLNNAIKYSPNGKQVTVTCELEDGKVKVSVRDEGIGVKPEDQAKIFDRYYRIERDDTRHISGFGIGLYLSAEIVRRHDGQIWVESESGKGSTFCFTLPLSA
ncbi:PAS domain-containing protein [Desertivirga xinjiangensis]|uniref:PAS domain-containing protein n=1 Tax=Desertivirga xinjiangensis TaxID=539206 RepID=UPI00210DF76C|nr:PAS domain-containing protein [Pedobacter xinjiangensis]